MNSNMGTLFGNNAVNHHTENKVADNSSMREQNSPVGFTNEAAKQDAGGFDDCPSFGELDYKDGRPHDYEQEEWVERKKCTMAEIEGRPIKITGIHERKSKLYDDGTTYISINFINTDGEECFVNTSGKTIRKQIDEKNINYPFRATIKSCPKKDNPGVSYYKLS